MLIVANFKNYLFLNVLWCASMAWAEPSFPVTELTVGMYRVEAEVAATPETREFGLMRRQSMTQNHGMVFVFPQLQQHCMWMRNTLLPLSVAFMDDKGVILNIEDMQPQTDDNHCAASPARYALEMNLGWFKSRGFKPGTAIVGVDRLRQVR